MNRLALFALVMLGVLACLVPALVLWLGDHGDPAGHPGEEPVEPVTSLPTAPRPVDQVQPKAGERDRVLPPAPPAAIRGVLPFDLGDAKRAMLSIKGRPRGNGRLTLTWTAGPDGMPASSVPTEGHRCLETLLEALVRKSRQEWPEHAVKPAEVVDGRIAWDATTATLFSCALLSTDDGIPTPLAPEDLEAHIERAAGGGSDMKISLRIPKDENYGPPKRLVVFANGISCIYRGDDPAVGQWSGQFDVEGELGDQVAYTIRACLLYGDCYVSASTWTDELRNPNHALLGGQ